jgi:hypothetical protein
MSRFDKNKRYKSTCVIFSPQGLIAAGTVLTGGQWKNVLVYGVGERSFDGMFDIVDDNDNLIEESK